MRVDLFLTIAVQAAESVWFGSADDRTLKDRTPMQSPIIIGPGVVPKSHLL
jgi:hypothetical protein